MLSFLDPRMWLAAFLALSLTGFGCYFKGRHDANQSRTLIERAAVAQADSEARKMEQLRQRGVDESLKSAASRERRLLAVVADVRAQSDGLRGDLDAVQRASGESLASADNALRTVSDLFGSCVAAYSSVAESADRATSEAVTLRQAWPK